MNILVVCSGNICRSPMAEAYLRHRLDGETVSRRHRVTSAGTLGIVDEGAAAAAVAVLQQEVGVDLTAHRSRGLSREEVEDADIILVMEAAHRRFIGTFYPAHLAKVRLLTEFAPSGGGVSRGAEVFDPVGLDPEAFRTCFRIMQACLDALIETFEA